MAYQVKSIRYQGSARKILLQNENGPCPLLAATNALLMRGSVRLPPECVRCGVASIDDVVNVLADRALSTRARATTETANVGEGTGINGGDSGSEGDPGAYHLNEALSLLPDLQRGMDVNPKFNTPTSVEYTRNLAAFDLLGVELVHGWIVDPQDEATADAVGQKSYNELVELVIHGNEAAEVVERLREEIRTMEGADTGDNCSSGCDTAEEVTEAVPEVGSEPNQQQPGEGQASGTPENSGEGAQSAGDVENEAPESLNDRSGDGVASPAEAEAAAAAEPSRSQPAAPETPSTGDNEQTAQPHGDIPALEARIDEQSLLASRALILNAFLTSTSHQLTYHGLHSLQAHVADDAMCVFFRNNHFATLTKRDGVLYLLVTDLGYANVPEVVWEKLDVIDGNTEYANEFFAMPKPREALQPASGPTIAPELLLAQRGQAETDYQLALAMSGGGNATRRTNNDDEEGRLIEAAKEMSLRTYHGESDGAADPVAAAHQRENSDRAMALDLSRQGEREDHESEQLARQLQELEYTRQRQDPRSRPARRPPAAPKPAAASSSCVVS